MVREKFVIISAGGNGVRMGTEMPKQFLSLGGKPVLQMTIEKFISAVPEIKIITVLPHAYMEWWKNHCQKSNFTYRQTLVPGGITRFHSVRNALEKVPDGAIVAVHDGVRPFISVGALVKMFSLAEDTPALIPLIPCVDTLKAIRMVDNKLEAIPGARADRNIMFGAQTPQIFHSELLKKAYELPYDTNFTDDASVVEAMGKPLSYIMGERLNIKITTQEDLTLAQAIMLL